MTCWAKVQTRTIISLEKASTNSPSSFLCSPHISSPSPLFSVCSRVQFYLLRFRFLQPLTCLSFTKLGSFLSLPPGCLTDVSLLVLSIYVFDILPCWTGLPNPPYRSKSLADPTPDHPLVQRSVYPRLLSICRTSIIYLSICLHPYPQYKALFEHRYGRNVLEAPRKSNRKSGPKATGVKALKSQSLVTSNSCKCNKKRMSPLSNFFIQVTPLYLSPSPCT